MHLRDGSRGGDDPRSKPFREQSGAEPVIAMTVRDEDVRKLPAVCDDPVAERMRLVGCERGVGQDRILAPIDERARNGREPLRLSVRKDAVLWRRLADEYIVTESAPEPFPFSTGIQLRLPR